MMIELYGNALTTVWGHRAAFGWAVVAFFCGALIAWPAVRYDVRSLLALPRRLMQLARSYLRPDSRPVPLFLFIFFFNAATSLVYVLSGGLVVLPVLLGIFAGLNVGAVLMLDAREASLVPPPDPEHAPEPRAWVGLCNIFFVVVELAAIWLSIGMGISLGHAMRAEFTWSALESEAWPRLAAYGLVVVPALAASAVAETAAIKAMVGTEAAPDAEAEAEAENGER
jgi:hypothetical protein